MKTLISATLIIFSFKCFCQTELPDFIVRTVIGPAYIKANGKETMLKQGTLLYKKDIIEIKEASHLTLLDHDNNYILLKNKGTYPVSNLGDKKEVQPSGISARFWHFIWEDLFKPKSERSLTTGSAKGRVSRGECDFRIGPIRDEKTDSDTITFQWHPIKNSTQYVFNLKDAQQKEIITLILNDTSISILKQSLLKDEKNDYHWSITPANSSAIDCSKALSTFTVTSHKEKKETIGALIKDVKTDDDLFVYNMNVSAKLSENGWYKDAESFYLKALGSLDEKN